MSLITRNEIRQKVFELLSDANGDFDKVANILKVPRRDVMDAFSSKRRNRMLTRKLITALGYKKVIAYEAIDEKDNT